MPFLSADSAEPPEASVIIPLHKDGERFRRCLASCLAMQVSTTFEVIVVSDQPVQDLSSSLIRTETGSLTPTSPAIKRDIGETLVRGQVLAFLDDDAYPSTNWLDAAMDALRGSAVHGVGGPGLTPPDSSWRERLGGAVYESRLGSGPLRRRFLPVGPARDCDDLPAYNLVIRRDAIVATGGWASNYYGGEDTKLCLALVDTGFRLRYDPSVIVYHYRRPFLRPHLRQVANVGRHRGYFFRKYPSTSRRGLYTLPALGAIGMVPAFFGAALAIRAAPRPSSAVLAGGWLALSVPRFRKLGVAALAFPLLLLSHHLAYGLNFLRGLCTLTLRDLDGPPEARLHHSVYRTSATSGQVD
jgi:GT2 family glycosyltransferase